MEGVVEVNNRRSVLVETVRGPIEGRLVVGARTRTSDHLNLACRRFVQLEVDEVLDENWSFCQGRLGISTSSVLFVLETQNLASVSDARIERARFTRETVRMQVGPYQIEGFIHVPALSDPMTRLLQNRLPFVAVTSASVIGPKREFAATFLAINPDHLLVIQSEPRDGASEAALSEASYAGA